MKRIVTVPLVAMLLAGCWIGTDKEARVLTIADRLCAAAAHGETLEKCPDVVSVVGADKLAEMSGELQKGYSIEMFTGDAPSPLGDGSGTHHVLIHTETSGLGLRFKYDQQRDQFHILGYWTL